MAKYKCGKIPKRYAGHPVHKGYVIVPYSNVREMHRLRCSKSQGWHLTDNPKDTFQLNVRGLSKQRAMKVSKRLINQKKKRGKINWSKVWAK